MNNKAWIGLYLFTLIVHLAAPSLPVPYLEMVSKALLMIVLLNWFIAATNDLSSALKKWITGAICFSWLGDVLLLFQGRDALFFMLGLAAFLIAHIFYIIFFQSIKTNEKVASRNWLLIPVFLYYATLITILYPHLAAMKVPVTAYGIVISCMLLLALHMLFIKEKKAGQWIAAGAVLFIASDSVLAINKFYQPFQKAGIIIMITYGLAQLFIIAGAIQYLRKK